MATLQTSRQSSAFTARSRLKQTYLPTPGSSNYGPVSAEQVITTPVQASPRATVRDTTRQPLSDLDNRQMLLETVRIYTGWRLISLQHHSENNTLVAHLLREGDQSDPTVAINEGRSLQIIMDGGGDMKVVYARSHRSNPLFRWFARLGQKLTGHN